MMTMMMMTMMVMVDDNDDDEEDDGDDDDDDDDDTADDRTCGAKVKDFIVEDYYVPRGEIIRQIISGILAALAVVPESIAFALVVGVQPQVGIDTTFVTSIVIGIVGARPGLVNGASGAIAVVIVTIVQQYGERYMGYTVILAGIFIIIFSLLRLSMLVCLISAPVMVGFVNGLGIIMCLAQVKVQSPEGGRERGGGGGGRQRGETETERGEREGDRDRGGDRQTEERGGGGKRQTRKQTEREGERERGEETRHTDRDRDGCTAWV